MNAARTHRVIVITGASAGIGRAAALAFAKPGVCLALLARGQRGLAATGAAVEAKGAQVLLLPTDVADATQVEVAAQIVEENWGGIDVWVNNAMATIFGPVSALSPDDVKRATDVTYLGAVYGTLSALKRMRARDKGVIVQVGSALAYRGIPLQAPYCAAKHALRGFTDSLRCELLHDRSRIRLTMVHLAAFNTPQFDWALNLVGRRATPLPPIFQPEIAARAIVWAAEHERREVFVGWPALKAVLANKLAPGWVDRVLAATGYDAQMSKQSVSEGACANLYDACDTDPGAHGRFDDVARAHSWQWLFTSHRGAIIIATLVIVVVIAALFI